jgi:hypothetical protein
MGERVPREACERATQGHPAREFKLECQFGECSRHAGAGGADAQIFKPLDQLRDSPTAGLPPGEASHDCLPQVDVKNLDFNEFFQGLAGFSSTKSVAHAAYRYLLLEKFTKLKRCNIPILALNGQGS